MHRRQKPKPDNNLMVIVLICVLVTALAGGYLIWRNYMKTPEVVVERKAEPVKEEKPPETKPAPTPVETGPAIDYDRMQKDVDYRDLMAARKEKYGVDESVDMIVKADENVTVGGTTIPMEEILEKIRLQKSGDMIEKDLGAKDPATLARDREAAFEKLREAEKRHAELESALNAPDAADDPEKYREQMAEYTKLGEVVREYKEYKQTLTDIGEHEELLREEEPGIEKRLAEDIAQLGEEKEDLEKVLMDKIAARIAGDAKKDFRTPDVMKDELEASGKRLAELDSALADPKLLSDLEKYRLYVRERMDLGKMMMEYQIYQKIETRMDSRKEMRSAGETGLKEHLAARLESLEKKKDYLEKELMARFYPDDVDVYGIYVVMPGDNVWNIHFDFLKEYFGKRGVNVLPAADEPLKSGVSSGVGKILKFSETMVHIYNLRERNLSVDLNLIHPLSKIVIFNLGQAFSLLSQIDYRQINEIRFDGDTLWLPAEE